MTNAQDTNPPPLTNAVCMHCGYDISGTIPNEDAKVTCPECGIELQRSEREILTRRAFHMKLVYILALPFATWSLLTLLLAIPPLTDSMLFGLFFVLFLFTYPIALLITLICAWTRLHALTEPHPRPYERRTIPLWAMAYTAGLVGVYIGVIVTVEWLQ